MSWVTLTSNPSVTCRQEYPLVAAARQHLPLLLLNQELILLSIACE